MKFVIFFLKETHSSSVLIFPSFKTPLCKVGKRDQKSKHIWLCRRIFFKNPAEHKICAIDLVKTGLYTALRQFSNGVKHRLLNSQVHSNCSPIVCNVVGADNAKAYVQIFSSGI